MADEPIYQNAFQRSGPVATFDAVHARLALSKAFTQDLATYYSERAAVEDVYVKSLEKLAGKLHGSTSPAILSAVHSLGLSSTEENRQLGSWKALRARVEAEVTDTAKMHEVWAKKVAEEVAAPLKASTTKGEWAKWNTVEHGLAQTARDYDQTLDKVQKAQQKGGTKSSKSTQSKLLSSQSHLSQLGSTLTSSLPAFLTLSQSVDLSHGAFLKEALVRHGTICSDLGRERMEQGERLLVGVFEVDEHAEAQGWALREGQKTASSGGANGASPSAPYLNEFGQTSTRTGAGSVRTESIAEERPGPMLPPPVPTARERQNSTPRAAPPPVGPISVPTEAPSSSGSKFGGGKKLKGLFKRDRSGSGTAASSKYGNINLGNSSSRVDVSRPSDRHSISSRDSESIAGPEEPTGLSAPAFNRSVSAASSTMGNMPPPIQPDAPKPKKRDSLMPFSNGGSLFRRKSTLNPSPMSSPAFDRSEPILSESPVNTPAATSAQVDEEGYSVPPAGYDRGPGQTTNLMDDSDDEAADGLGAMSSAPRLPAVALAPAAITETSEDRAAALARVQSALLSSPPSTGSSASPLGGLAAPASLSRRTTRGRRDVRMSTYQPNSTDDVPLAKVVEQHRAQNGGASPSISPPVSPNFGSPAAFGNIRSPDRANSMLSTLSGSTTSRAVGGHKDPFEGVTSPGLRASIVETVNVLSKGGEISRVMITGEISLSHKLTPGATGPVKIRITNFEQFEKAAPNAAYISPLADCPGEYTVSPALAAHGSTATVLKYQLHVAPGQEGFFVPLSVKAAWKCEQNLTRVIVTYEPNPSAVFAGKASSESSPFGDDESDAPSLEDVGFLLPMSVPVSTFQAKPTASWSAEKSRLGFSLEPIALASTAGESKLLASLNTEQLAAPQPIAVRWKVAGRTVSSVGLEIVEGADAVEDLRRATVTGKYLVA